MNQTTFEMKAAGLVATYMEAYGIDLAAMWDIQSLAEMSMDRDSGDTLENQLSSFENHLEAQVNEYLSRQ